MEASELLRLAFDVAEKAYAPYSRVRVGAALLLADGEVVTGINVENRSFGLTNCAERTALYTALTRGKKDFAAIAVACPDSPVPVSPCGACRQVLSEFVPAGFPVYFRGGGGRTAQTTDA